MKTRYLYMAAWSVLLPLVLPIPWASWFYLVAFASIALGFVDRRIDLTTLVTSQLNSCFPPKQDHAHLALDDQKRTPASYDAHGLKLLEQEEGKLEHSLERVTLHRSQLANCSRRGFAAFLICGTLTTICLLAAWLTFSQHHGDGLGDAVITGILWLIGASPFALCTLVFAIYPMERTVHGGSALWSSHKANRAQTRVSAIRSNLAIERGLLSEAILEEHGQLELLHSREPHTSSEV